MTLRVGWLEKNDWGVVYQVTDPKEALGNSTPLWERDRPWEDPSFLSLHGIQDLFRGGLVLITTQDLPEGTNLLLFFHPPGSKDAWLAFAENLHTESLMKPGHFRSSLRVLSLREAPLNWGFHQGQVP